MFCLSFVFFYFSIFVIDVIWRINWVVRASPALVPYCVGRWCFGDSNVFISSSGDTTTETVTLMEDSLMVLGSLLNNRSASAYAL